jgi:PHD-finger
MDVSSGCHTKPKRVRGRHKITCEACGGYGTLIECDTCTSSWHGLCVEPAIDPDTPPDWWSCPACLEYGPRVSATSGPICQLQTSNSDVEAMKDVCHSFESPPDAEYYQEIADSRGQGSLQGPSLDERERGGSPLSETLRSQKSAPPAGILTIQRLAAGSCNISAHSTSPEPVIQSDPCGDREHSAESQHHRFMNNAYEYRGEISPPNSSDFPSPGVRELKGISMALTAHRVQVAGTELDLNDSGPPGLSNGFQEVQKGWLMVLEGVAKSQSTIRILEEALSAKNAQLEELQWEIHQKGMENEHVRRERDEKQTEFEELMREHEQVKMENEDFKNKMYSIVEIVEEVFPLGS